MNTLPLFILVMLSFMQVPNCIDTACHAAKQPPLAHGALLPRTASSIRHRRRRPSVTKKSKRNKKSKSCKSIFDETKRKAAFPAVRNGKSGLSFGFVDWKGTRRRKRQRSAACRRPMRRAFERLCSVYSARSFFMAGMMRLTTHQAMTATAITMITIFTMSEKPSTC